MRILVVDDHSVVREGLKQILAEAFSSVEFGFAMNAAEAMELVKKKTWDVAIFDISLPGRSGLELLKDVKALKPKIPVLIHSMHAEDEFAVRALKAGASGYLSKSEMPDEIVKAIHKVTNGGKFVSASLAEKLASYVQDNDKKLPHEKLSDREYQILLMIASGKTSTEIADDLSLSIKTISTFRARILEKMNLKTNADLIYYVIEHKLKQT